MAKSFKARVHLTAEEEQIIAKTSRCPDCGGTFAFGPRGGAAQTFCCKKCHSEFNISFWKGGVLAQRISDRGPRDVGDRAWCYKL